MMLDPHYLDAFFPRLAGFPENLPAWCVTHNLSRCIHRFHHTSPLSPSGRFLALTRLPREDKRIFRGQKAGIILIDLQKGTASQVAKTLAWDTQLGAQVQWGRSDHELLYNILGFSLPPKVRCRVHNPMTDQSHDLDGPLYDAHPEPDLVASCCLLRIGRTQPGYGVLIPSWLQPKNLGALENDGIYLTNLDSGKCHLLTSWARIIETCGLTDWAHSSTGIYGFHVQWNHQGSCLLLVLRRLIGHRKREPILLVVDAASGDPTILVGPGRWQGNHPCWMPDGENIIMNLDVDGRGLKFVKINASGAGITVLSHHAATRGHPSLHPNGEFIVTDDYAKNDPQGTAPLILLNLKKQKMMQIGRIDAQTKYIPRKKSGNPMRVDLHPSWSTNGQWLTFNAVRNGSRSVNMVYTGDIGASL